MNKYFCLLIVVVFSGCGINSSQFRNDNKTNINCRLHTNTYHIAPDSILIKSSIVFPISNLVFIKKENSFFASTEITLRFEDELGNQVERISRINKIEKFFYEDTRTSELYEILYDIILPKDDYNIIVTLKDLDSFNVWSHSGSIKSYNQDFALFWYPNRNKIKDYIFNDQISNIDTLWVEIPKYQFGINNYEYSILKGNDTLSFYKTNNCIESSESLLFECPILISDETFGDIKLNINSKLNENLSFEISINKDLSLWSSEINDILGVMSYILSYSEIKLLYKLSEKEQLEFVENYIKNKDLDLTTNQNEFLELLKIRYQYANNNFSNFNIGWKTDRGKIYIIYGEPLSKEFVYDNNKMSNKEIWYYEDRVFMFSDERTLGEFELIKEL